MMKYLFLFTFCITLLFINTKATAQSTIDSLAIFRLKEIASTIKYNSPTISDKTITTPTVPAAYHLTFISSDCLPVISRDGNIHSPLVDLPVHLYYTLSDNLGNKVDVPSLQIEVPGRYNNQANSNSKPFVVPALREWLGKEGNFIASSKITLAIDPTYQTELKDLAETFVSDYAKLLGRKITIRYGKPQNGNIFITLNNDEKTLGDEGYMMEVGNILTIKANKSTGCFWGTRTVLQLLEQSTSIPRGIARDYPKYQRRGFMLDCGRKFFTIDFLRDYVKFMSYYKMNEFQIHLNDNGFKQFFNNNWDSTYSAFRLESTTFPALTAKDGHYTKKEFIDLQELAKQYGVNIVPEIDAPAHTLAFYQFDHTLGSKEFGSDHLDLDNPHTYQFLDALFKEYLEGPNPVFRGKEVHIGTDEYSNKAAEKFRAFTDRYIRYVESFGKRARVWGALTHAKGTTPVKSENVIMDDWYNGYAEPADMIKLGYDLMSVPDGLIYIVPAAGYYYDYLNDKWLYENWEPVQIGDAIFPYGHPQILGGKFAVWNDHVGNGISEKDVHHRVLNSMKVMSQKMWMGNNKDITFDAFIVKAKQLNEAPGVNVEGRVKTKDDLVLHYNFNNRKIEDQSANKYNATTFKKLKRVASPDGRALSLPEGTTIQLPITEVGYNYTVIMKLKREKATNGTTLFQSPNAILWLSDKKTGQLGFSRDGYTYTFNYTIPLNEWTTIAIEGDNKGTSLYVNTKLAERLEGKKREFIGTKSKTACIQTLVFPLKAMGSLQNKESLFIDDLKVYNRMLTVEEIGR
ncbi:MAG: family 20 glycosylhydrolase [Bacteroidetes bacterium]|nr:family 20 glycosylhydrolase [Bacteroidota bacterium]